MRCTSLIRSAVGSSLSCRAPEVTHSPFLQCTSRPSNIRTQIASSINKAPRHKAESGKLYAAAISNDRMPMKTVDLDQVKQDWTKRGFSFGVFVDPPGRVWPDFTHQTDELVMLTKGEFELTFNGKSVRPDVGEEVLIPAKALHTVENTGDVTNEWLYGYKRR